MRLEVRLLGEIEIHADGREIPLGHARQRCVLAALAVDAGRVVPVPALIDRVWERRRPGDARNVLYSYIARLRRALAGIDEVAITHRSGGYLLAIDPLAVDLHRFRHLAGQARAEADDQTARALFAQARELWRGPALPGLVGEYWDTQRDELTREQFAAELDHTDLRLRAGEDADLLPELRARAAALPLDERAAAQFMLASYHAGRPAAALHCYQDIRRRLLAELGAEPGPELRRLHARILAADPAPGGAAAVVPHQLPAPPRPFTGRHREIARLSELTPGTALEIITIVGAGGTGKTWLALTWAHQHADRFPDGQLHVNLRGFDPADRPVPPGTALRGFLDALGVAPGTVPGEVEEQAALFRSLVTGKRLLIVADNARDADQVVPLLPASPTCAVLITSRHRLTGLVIAHGAHVLELGMLPTAEARTLLAGYLGEQRLAAEPDAVADLLAMCAGLPLALGITAARAARHPAFALSVLVKELRADSARLDALDGGDPRANLRAVLATSYRALSGPAATALALVALAPGPDIGLAAVAALTGLPSGLASALLRELEDASQLEQHRPGRYRMHDLIRLYTAEQADQLLPAADRAAALHRLVDFYLHTAYAGDRLLDPHRDLIDLTPPAADGHPEPLADAAAALEWFTTEHPNLLAVAELAAAHGWPTAVWQLAWALDTFHYRRGHLVDRVAQWQAALAVTDPAAEPRTCALVRRQLGYAYVRAGRYAEAGSQLTQALIFAEESGDLLNQICIHECLAWACGQQSDRRRALRHAIRVIRLARVLANAKWELSGLNSAGWHLAHLGHHDAARAACMRSLALARTHNNHEYIAYTLDSLGYLAQHTGQPGQALDHYQQALDQYRDLGDSYNEADTLDRVGEVHFAGGRHPEARAAWQQAHDLFVRQHRPAAADRMADKLRMLTRWGGPGA